MKTPFIPWMTILNIKKIFSYDLDRYIKVLASMFVFSKYQSVSYICLYIKLDEGSNHYLWCSELSSV